MKELDELSRHEYNGHSVLMGKRKMSWQDTKGVLGVFGEKLGAAKRAYRGFVKKGTAQGSRPELSGGGLLQSPGGWDGVKAFSQERLYQRNDERILGDGNIVGRVPASAQESMERRYALRAGGVNLDTIRISITNVSESVTRGRGIAAAKGCSLMKPKKPNSVPFLHPIISTAL